MNIRDIVAKAAKLVSDNSPAILTAIGVTGTITTAYLTGKASYKAAEIIKKERIANSISPNPKMEPDLKDDIKAVWKLYIPAVSTGALTVAAIVVANRIGTRRAAAIAAAYAISQEAWDEYKEKVVDKIGSTKEQKIRDEIAQDQVDRNPVKTKEIIITGTGEHRCYDSISGRYFKSSMETLRRSQNDINAQIISDNFATLAEFWTLIGLPITPYSKAVGWNVDKLLELEFSSVLGTDGEPCLSFHYTVYPTKDYHRLR
jgi:Family of unknown function (DUF6353)